MTATICQHLVANTETDHRIQFGYSVEMAGQLPKLPVHPVPSLGRVLKARKMSMAKLGEAIGANRMTIWRYVNGVQEPNTQVVLQIAAALHTTPTELRTRDIDEIVAALPPKVRAPAQILTGLSEDQLDGFVKTFNPLVKQSHLKKASED